LLKKITKRDLQFEKKIKKLPEEWLSIDDWLVMKDKNYGEAEYWKFIVYKVHLDAKRSLFYAYSNQHPNLGYGSIKTGNKIILKTQILKKAYYFRYCVLLLQACGDKLSQLVRCAMKIERWKDNRNSKAEENNTSLQKLKNYLEQDEQEPKTIYNAINEYLEDKNVKLILKLANKIKHKWTTFYQGEGLAPLRPTIQKIKDSSGKIIGECSPIGVNIGEDIACHIRCALVANNLFIEMTEKIVRSLDFDKFYSYENGKKILYLKPKKE
jgi:hypothetical protein